MGCRRGLHLSFAEYGLLAVVSEQPRGLLAAAHGTFQGGRVGALDVVATRQQSGGNQRGRPLQPGGAGKSGAFFDHGLYDLHDLLDLLDLK